MKAKENLPIEEIHPRKRYPGKRWQILFGRYEGPEKFAILELQRQLQSYLPYVLPVAQAGTGDGPGTEEHLILVGTLENNPMIRECCKKANVSIPAEPEAYTVACLPTGPNGEKGRRTIILAGRDARGVLYAVTDFCARVLGCDVVRDDPATDAGVLEELGERLYSEKPGVPDRGIWTWGYVMYDYRGFLDNMARLRMNMLTIWNDVPPLNMPEIIEYAHERGIRVILGFHWGWGLKFDLDNDNHIREVGDHVLLNYREHYAHLNHDGIYFQTATETDKREVNGVSRAKLVCGFVNRVGGSLLEKYPDLFIQFGLHATSILGDYTDLKDLDKRISIVWEDAGVTPYSYLVSDTVTGWTLQDNADWKNEVGSAQKTIDYSVKIAHLRKGCGFGLVPKGFSKLRWTTEFEHHGPFILGERSGTSIRRRLLERGAAWNKENSLWLKHYKLAVRFFREIIKSGQDRITVTALVEDGMFETEIPFCVSLFAQIRWDPFANEDEMAVKAMSAYYGGRL